MTIAVASNNCDFSQRFCACIQENEGIRICGPAKNGRELTKLLQGEDVDGIVFEFSEPWSGPVYNYCKVNFAGHKNPIIMHFSKSATGVFSLSSITYSFMDDTVMPHEKENQRFSRMLTFSSYVVKTSAQAVRRSLEQRITEVQCVTVKVLNNLGISPTTKGYHYLIDAVTNLYTNPEKTVNIKSGLYAEIAAENNTTSLRVSKSLNHAIASCADHLYMIGIGGSSPENGKRMYTRTMEEAVVLRIYEEIKALVDHEYETV